MRLPRLLISLVLCLLALCLRAADIVVVYPVDAVAPGERAVLVDEEKYELGTHLLDGFVFAEEKWVVC